VVVYRTNRTSIKILLKYYIFTISYGNNRFLSCTILSWDHRTAPSSAAVKSSAEHRRRVPRAQSPPPRRRRLPITGPVGGAVPSPAWWHRGHHALQRHSVVCEPRFCAFAVVVAVRSPPPLLIVTTYSCNLRTVDFKSLLHCIGPGQAHSSSATITGQLTPDIFYCNDILLL